MLDAIRSFVSRTIGGPFTPAAPPPSEGPRPTGVQVAAAALLLEIAHADGEFSEVVALGGAGVVSGVSSVLPEPFLKVRDALRTGDESALSDAQDLARRAIDATNQGDLVHLKAVLTLRGLPASGTRAAFDPLTPQARRELEAAVSDLL